MRVNLDPEVGRAAHALFELLAYAVAFYWLRRQRRTAPDFLAPVQRWTLIAAAIVGAALGSKVLHHLAHPGLWAQHFAEPRALLGGKTIVGALLGGWWSVEWLKARMGVRRRTGDLYVMPLLIGMAIGRLGCFLAGLSDDTFGVATSLPVAIDFGDGVPRHPVQLYEVAFLVALAWGVRRPWVTQREGRAFRIFLAAYLGFRLAVDFWKPYERVAGLGVLQWACVLGLLILARGALRSPRPDPAEPSG